jgi:hypothetical protein
MVGALLSFCVMAVAIRRLSGPLTVMEILTLRAALGLAIIGVVAIFRPAERHSINMRRLPLHILRNSVHFGSQYLWALGLVLLPRTVFALEFTMRLTTCWRVLSAAYDRPHQAALAPSACHHCARGAELGRRPDRADVGYGAEDRHQVTRPKAHLRSFDERDPAHPRLAFAGALLQKLTLDLVPAIAGLGGLFAFSCLSNAFRAGDASVVVPLDFAHPADRGDRLVAYDEPPTYPCSRGGITIAGSGTCAANPSLAAAGAG